MRNKYYFIVIFYLNFFFYLCVYDFPRILTKCWKAGGPLIGCAHPLRPTKHNMYMTRIEKETKFIFYFDLQSR